MSITRVTGTRRVQLSADAEHEPIYSIYYNGIWNTVYKAGITNMEDENF
jgi:hypothetical protein